MPARIRIGLASIFVEDQEAAVRFYTEKLDFVVRSDETVGEFRWVTVASPAGAEGVELLLEPNAHAAASAYQKAIKADGIPATTFFVFDVRKAVKRLEERGVVFTTPPAESEYGTMAIFDDTCGNLIQLFQK